MIRKLTIIFLSLTLGIFAAAEVQKQKRYGVESAKIIYDISGGGVLTSESNVTFEGTETFYMREWGAERLSVVEITERVSGAIEDVHTIKKIKKYKDGFVYEADLLKKKIIKYKEKPGIIEGFDLSKMKESGKQMVGSVECTVWKGEEGELCLYKGLVLVLKKSYMGFTYLKRPRSVSTDIQIPATRFVLPDFPIRESMLLSTGIKATKLHERHLIAEKILQKPIRQERGDKVTKQMRQKFGRDIYLRQKEKLPFMLKSMRKARACFSVAENQKEANECMKALYAPHKEMLNEEALDLSLWSDDMKEKVLNYLEEHITRLERDMPCIKRAENIDDLSKCLK